MHRLLTVLLAGLLGGTALAPATPAQADTRRMPGSFTGYAFDACQAPDQRTMDVWRERSPYRGVGIYVSGRNRYCSEQVHLDAAWVSEQARKGWLLLPLHVGRQASCAGVDRWAKISAKRAGDYRRARAQGRQEAREAVAAARAHGIGRRSTLWYDLESFDISRTRCRESALSLVSAWTRTLHDAGFRSGFYSSASTGITMLERARTTPGNRYTLPDQLWVGEWNGAANTRSAYLPASAWEGERVHQYLGGHDESYGGRKVNIDSNFLRVGGGSRAPKPATHCGQWVGYTVYPSLERGDRDTRVAAAQCFLRRLGHYEGRIQDRFTRATKRAVTAFQRERATIQVDGVLTRRTWTALLSQGSRPLLKYGSASNHVRRLQRALNAAGSPRLAVDGVFAGRTLRAVKAYQRGQGLPRTGVVTEDMWGLVQHGRR